MEVPDADEAKLTFSVSQTISTSDALSPKFLSICWQRIRYTPLFDHNVVNKVWLWKVYVWHLL